MVEPTIADFQSYLENHKICTHKQKEKLNVELEKIIKDNNLTIQMPASILQKYVKRKFYKKNIAFFLEKMLYTCLF